MSSSINPGIVLAGGRSRRMGRDKARLPFAEDATLLARVVGRVASVCRPVIVVARDASAHPDCGADVIGDRRPDQGPLGGLHTGLTSLGVSHAALNSAVVIACDLPFIEPALLAGLIERAPGWDAVVPLIAGRAQTLCAVYHRDVAQAAEAVLQRGGHSMHELLAAPGLRVCYVAEEELRGWDPALVSFTNVNTPEEFARAAESARNRHTR